MGTLLQDLAHAFRHLSRKPVFTVTAVLTLAIGLGVNAVAFSVVNGFLFKGYALGLPGVGRLATTPGGDEAGYASLDEYRRFRDATTGTLDLAAEGRSSLAWQRDGWAGHLRRRQRARPDDLPGGSDGANARRVDGVHRPRLAGRAGGSVGRATSAVALLATGY